MRNSRRSTAARRRRRSPGQALVEFALVIPVFLLVFVAIAVVLYLVGADLYTSLPKLAAAALVGFLFLRFFEKLSWVVLLALLIPTVDTLSVWRGPTHYVVTQKPQVFDLSSVAFPIPGERTITVRWQTPPKETVSGWRIYRRVGGGREQLLAPSPFCPRRDRCGQKLSFSDGSEPSGKKIRYRIAALQRGATPSVANVVFPPAGKGAPLYGRRAGAAAPRDLRATSAPTSAGRRLRSLHAGRNPSRLQPPSPGLDCRMPDRTRCGRFGASGPGGRGALDPANPGTRGMLPGGAGPITDWSQRMAPVGPRLSSRRRGA